MTLARLLAAGAAFAASCALAEVQTVCTITVNSADEREAFRQHLPESRFRFVELAERGRADWLGEACRRQVRCDVLVVSGHFAGTAFYSSKHGEHLPVDEMERVACGESCAGLFAGLREVYLFGCDTLKPDPVASATPEIVRALLASGTAPAEAAAAARSLSERHGESARDRMRRIFPGVPVIYGFSSLAPYGRIAGPMLRSYFESGGAEEVGRGVASRSLLRIFGPASLVAASGQQPHDRDAPYRAEACRYHDDRLTAAGRLAFMREILAGEAAALRMNFDRIERFLAALPAPPPGWADDDAARANYLAVTRATGDPALRARMVSLARRAGWLDAQAERAELARMIGEMLAAGSAGYGEVDLICGLGREIAFESELARFDIARLAAAPANAAALACLGSETARRRVLRAVTSSDEREVQLAQAYLRHRPLGDADEIAALVREVVRMKPSGAQARALETLARQPLSGAGDHEELAGLFARTRSAAVQRAIAEIFLRAGAEQPRAGELAAVLRRHRLGAGGGGDVIDAALARLEARGS